MMRGEIITSKSTSRVKCQVSYRLSTPRLPKLVLRQGAQLYSAAASTAWYNVCHLSDGEEIFMLS